MARSRAIVNAPIQLTSLLLLVAQALLVISPFSQHGFAQAQSNMGVFNQVPAGLDEVDVIIVGGEWNEHPTASVYASNCARDRKQNWRRR